MIYLIEKLWVDSLENQNAFGYEPYGYVTTEEEAKQLAESEFKDGTGWPLKYVNAGQPVPVYKYKVLEKLHYKAGEDNGYKQN